jgi:hypothetical protein
MFGGDSRVEIELRRPKIECEKSDAYTPRSKDKAVSPLQGNNRAESQSIARKVFTPL